MTLTGIGPLPSAPVCLARLVCMHRALVGSTPPVLVAQGPARFDRPVWLHRASLGLTGCVLLHRSPAVLNSPLRLLGPQWAGLVQWGYTGSRLG